MTFVLGLTGSIGMGKSATAGMFRALGIPVWDADMAVHALYRGHAAPLVEEAFPGTVEDGSVDRTKLATFVLNDPAAMKRLEAIVHPLVREDEEAFLRAARERRDRLVVLDIPLLYETDGRHRVDMVAVVTAPADIQRERVLSRPGMTEEKFEKILAKQVPDDRKRQMADFVIDTGQGMDAAEQAVADIIEKLTGERPRRGAAPAG